MPQPPRIALFANTEWYLYNFRLPLAKRLQVELGAEVWVICPDGPYRPRLEAEGFHWISAEIDRRGLNPVRDLAAASRLARDLRKARPDLLHNFTLKSILIGTLAARRAGTPRIVNAVTGLGSMFSSSHWGRYRLPRTLLEVFLRWTFRNPGIRTIFQNPGDLAQVATHAGHQGRCRLIAGSGIDTDRFHPSGHPSTPPTLILASRLLKDKGVGDFCEAASIVHQSCPEAVFQVAGEIDEGNPGSFSSVELEALKANFPMVQFLGHRDDMPDLYRQATLAILPSRYREGVPRSLLEAAASGLPLVAVDGEGIRDIVRHGSNGRLVPPKDGGALAETLLELLADSGTREAYGRESRRLVVEGFDQSRVLDATFAVYQELGFPPRSDAPERMRVEP